MPLELDFSSAVEQRNRITKEQEKFIHDLYKEASEEIGKKAEQAPKVPSDHFNQQYLRELQNQINNQITSMEGKIGSAIRSGMDRMSKSTVESAKQFLSDMGMPIKAAYSNVPGDVVRAVASGQLYKGNWTLSKALWLDGKNTQKDVQAIVAKGIAENKSAYDIAKDLEKYVNPDARKDWDWGKVYPGSKKVVDYNAQRLARTMVSHAYQQAFVRVTLKNPFVTKYQWQAAGTERTCEICNERDGQLYEKDELPLDHPNGMCTFIAVIEEDFDSIADRLADWVNGAEDPELDEWAEDIYGPAWRK